ncbi:hypothetical protein [Aliarcobacter butzleri]|uniref:hypothetical protein n=1 Tax=Aliarcobacter butzleri TaxID=28197 RepID=UPI003B2147F9
MDIVSQAMNKVESYKEKIKSEIEETSVEKRIEYYICELYKLEVERKKINDLKLEKDDLVKKYINNNKQPNRLNFNLLNYKALLFYFIDKFISDTDNPLSLENYKNLCEENKEFNSLFNDKGKIFINTKYTNFPHLIGYKEDENNPYKDTNKKFIEKIFYETNLIKDFTSHGCKKDKIETFSWIWTTLNQPIYVLTSKAIKQGSKLEGDVIFVSKRSIFKGNNKEIVYHYVSLLKINSEKNVYVINSHHPLNNHEFKLQFDIDKKIYEYKF